MAHRRQEARLGEVGFFRLAPGFVGVGFGGFEFGDQRVLLGPEFDRLDRGGIEPVGQEDEEELGAGRHQQHGDAVDVAAAAERQHDRPDDRHEGGVDRDRDRRCQRDGERAHHQQRRHQEEAGAGRLDADEEACKQRPGQAVQQFGRGQELAPERDACGGRRFGQKTPAQHGGEAGGQHDQAQPARDLIERDPDAGCGGDQEREQQGARCAVQPVLREDADEFVIEGALEPGR
ncbi:hypothetical protein QO058_25740 [Bosea vestrisii]|nr:hypothetical protein [Bosea vestrisii]WID96098.1 hypothetical protein QO058_25740 [Bosea vestrisii]